MPMQTTISSKYPVVIPKPGREHLNLKPKQMLTVIEKDGMSILIPKPSLDAPRGIAAGAKTDGLREKKDRYLGWMGLKPIPPWPRRASQNTLSFVDADDAVASRLQGMGAFF